VRLNDKVAIITGAASGMGKATAIVFAREGAKVVATDVETNGLHEVAESIRKDGFEVLELKLDVADEANWNEVVDKTLKTYGRIDILINNAGICGKDCGLKIDEMTTDVWNKYLAVNATGNFLGLKAVVPTMKQQKYGAIVNVSSINGMFGGNGVNYCSSKGANRMLARSAAIELAEFNIRVNSVHPGYIQTGMTKEIDDDPEYLNYFINKIPIKRPGKPEEIANLLLFLASDESSYIIGSEIVIDGGWTATI